MQVWRICKAKFTETAFSGEGARLYAGRWNPAGVRMVYASQSLALAAVEFFVHLDPSVAPDDLVSMSAILPDDKVERLDISELPKDWRSMDHPVPRKIGAEWAVSKRSVALQVPSVAVEGEWNLLLNPLHPGFAKIKIGKPKPFQFDARMFRSNSR